MNLNTKRQNNCLQYAALLRWVVITLFLGVAGLSYLYLKNQLYVLGTQRTHMEQELRDLISQNNVLEDRVSKLTSFTTIQHRLDDGWLKMVPISEHALAHVHTQEVNRWTASESGSGNQFQTVSHEGGSRR